MRTSRSPSSIARSSSRSADGVAMAVSASTTASLSARSPDASSGSIPSGAPGQAAGQPLQRLAMLRDDLARALQDGPRFAENVGDGAEVAGAQQIGDEVLDDRNQLGADRPVCLQLEQVEEHREDVATQVLGVLAIDILLEVLDLAVFQEIESGIEVVDRYQALALGRSLLLHAVLDLRGRRRRDRLALLDRDRVLRGELAERVRHELEVLRPQQREQVVRGVGLEVACLVPRGT